MILRVVVCHKTQSKLIVKSCLFCLQGTRVWLRENGQHFPSTVNSCAEGVVVFRTDYGQVSTVPFCVVTSVFCFLRQSYTRPRVLAPPTPQTINSFSTWQNKLPKGMCSAHLSVWETQYNSPKGSTEGIPASMGQKNTPLVWFHSWQFCPEIRSIGCKQFEKMVQICR